MQFHFLNYLLFFTTLLSLGLLRPGNSLHFRLFPLYLIGVSLIELIANYRRFELGLANHFVYNLFVILEFVYFSYFLSREIFNGIRKTWLWVRILILLGIVLNFLFIQGQSKFNTISNIVTSIYLIVAVLIFFLSLAKNPREGKLLANCSVWICFGLLVYKVMDVPFFSALNYLNDNNRETVLFYLYTLMPIANTIMYVSFIIAIICSYRTRNLSSRD